MDYLCRFGLHPVEQTPKPFRPSHTSKTMSGPTERARECRKRFGADDGHSWDRLATCMRRALLRQSLVPDPERAAIVRRLFKHYATGTYTKQQILQKATQWGLTNRRGQPLSSQAIGMLLRNRLYVGIIDVPEFGVRDQRGDFEPLTSQEVFYKAQAVLLGKVPVVAPLLKCRADFPLRGFVRRAVSHCGNATLRFPARSVASRTHGRSLTSDSARSEWPSVRRGLDHDMKTPRAMACCVGTAARVMVGESAAHV